MKAIIRKFIVLTAVAIISALFISCNGKNIEKKVSVERNYTSLNISTAIMVEWSETATEAIISADENTIDAVVLERNGQTLDIHLKVNWFQKNNFSFVKIILPSSPVLEDLTLSGASYFTSATVVDTEDLEIDISGASSFKANVAAESKLKIECSGASKFSGKVDAAILAIELNGASAAFLSGNVEEASFDLSGASSLKKLESKLVVTEDAEFSVSGASNVELNCKGNISGSVSGASSLRYGGPVKHNSISISGASSVRS